MNHAPPPYLDGFLAALGPESPGVASAPPGSAPLPSGEAAGPDGSPAAAKPRTREEQIKALLHPLDAFSRLQDCARQNRPPDPEDQFRFQWFGLFYQGPRQDAFRLRLRLPGGRIKPFQLSGLAEISQQDAGGCLLLNPAGGIDVPGVPVRAAADILRRLEGVGLSARQTGGDCVQAVCGGQYDGLDGDDPSPGAYPLIGELEQVLAHSRALSNLPEPCEVIFRSFGDALIRGPRQEQAIVFRAAPGQPSAPRTFPETESSPRFLCLPPGCDGGGFPLEAARVVPGCLALLGAWAEQGDRTYRHGAGLAAFCAGLGRERVGTLLGETTWQPVNPPPADHGVAGVRRLPTGLAVPGGRLLSGQLVRLAEVARERGLHDLRLADGQFHFAGAGADARTAQAFASALG